MTSAQRLVIVDDHPIFREGLAAILDSQPDLKVIAQGGAAAEAINLVQEHQPDMLLIDLEMPGGGLSVIEAVRAAAPQTRVAVLTASEDEQDAMAAFRAGASGYILKGVSARDLLAILRNVLAGQGYIPPSLGAQLVSGLAAPAQPAPAPKNPLAELTDREREILLHVAAGLSNKEIGYQLTLTEKTVKYYMSNILLKLKLRNRVEAALLVQRLREQGLLDNYRNFAQPG